MSDKQTILLIEEDKDFAQDLEENILELSNNYTVKTSHDGASALEILEKEKPDLMILDLRVPVMNGFQLLAELYKKGIWLPTIIITDPGINNNNSQLRISASSIR
jgi:DNA-binding response OmpR family regulator